MKIYNAKKASVQLPLGMRRLTISGKSLSQEFMPTSQFLQMIARTFSPKDMALIVSGAWEGNMCAEIPTLAEYVVPNVESAIARFNPPVEPEKEELKKEESKEKKSETTVPETKEEPEVESNPELPTKPEEEKGKEVEEKETKKAKRVRTAKRVTRKKKTDEEKSVEE